MLDVLAVDQHLAVVGIEEAQRKIDQRALARAGRPDQRHGLAGRHRQAHALQHHVLRIVGEGHVPELDLALLERERLGVGQLDQTDLAVDDAEHAACRGDAFLQLRLQGGDALERA